MCHSNIIATRLIENQLVLKKSKFPWNVKNNGKKSYVKASACKPLVKPPPRDKTLGIEPEIRFYALEDCDDTEEVEESEILVIHNSSLAAYKKNLVKRKFSYIDTFSHKVPAVVSAMRDLTIGVFDTLDITYPMDVYQRVA